MMFFTTKRWWYILLWWTALYGAATAVVEGANTNIEIERNGFVLTLENTKKTVSLKDPSSWQNGLLSKEKTVDYGIWEITGAKRKDGCTVSHHENDLPSVLSPLQFVTPSSKSGSALDPKEDFSLLQVFEKGYGINDASSDYLYSHLYYHSCGKINADRNTFRQWQQEMPDPFFGYRQYFFQKITDQKTQTALTTGSSLGYLSQFNPKSYSKRKRDYISIGTCFAELYQAYPHPTAVAAALKGKERMMLLFAVVTWLFSPFQLFKLGVVCSVVFAIFALFHAGGQQFFGYLREHFSLPDIISESSYEKRLIVRMASTVGLGKLVARILDRLAVMLYGEEVSDPLTGQDIIFDAPMQKKLDRQTMLYRKTLQENVRWAGSGKQRRLPLGNLLLKGPPGVGKSVALRYIAEVLCREGLAHYIVVDGASFSMFPEEQVVQIWRAIDREAKRVYRETGRPTLVIINEIEQATVSHIAVAASRKERINTSTLLTLFPEQMGHHMVLLGSTNLSLKKGGEEGTIVLDEAICNRFLHILPIDPPSAAIVKKMLVRKVEMKAHALGMVVLPEAVAALKELCDGGYFSGDVGRDIDGWAGELVSGVYTDDTNLRKAEKSIAAWHVLKKVQEEE